MDKCATESNYRQLVLEERDSVQKTVNNFLDAVNAPVQGAGDSPDLRFLADSLHNPELWERLTETQKRIADLVRVRDPKTGEFLSVAEIARLQGVSRTAVYKVLKQIAAKARKLQG